MRIVASTPALLAVLWLASSGLAAAQEPEPAPDGAVPRPAPIAARDSEAQGPDRAPGASGASRRAPTREPRAVRDGEAGRRADVDRPAAVRRAGPSSTASAAVAADDQSRGAQRRGADRRPPPSATRDTRDRAVPRTAVRTPRATGRVVVYPGGYPYYNRYYDPWGYGAFGLGYFYYSPWGWNPGYYGYGAGQYRSYGYAIGSVKLKVKPRDAEVYVDGYYAGQVDDFDGIFQSLKLDSGAYRIEVRKPGFEPLYFDVRVQPDRTITYRGELQPVP